MNCEDCRHLIRLDVGHDLHPFEQQRLAGHLNICAACQEYRREMEQCMVVLAAARESEPELVSRPSSSCWSTLSSHIHQRLSNQRSVRQFNGWVAAVCVASLLLAFGTILRNLPTAGPDVPRSVFPARSVVARTPVFSNDASAAVNDSGVARGNASHGAYRPSDNQPSVYPSRLQPPQRLPDFDDADPIF